jgi:predicted Zn-dependent protease
VAALSLALCVVGLSAALPSLASSTASSALVAASGRGGLDRAQQDAVLASRLDPLSDAGSRAEASVWLHRLRPARATTYLLEAVRREPSDEQAWISLSYAELAAGEQANALRSAQRALALDPLGTPAARLVRSVLQPQGLMQAPPNQSATAQPLTPQ